MAYLAMSLVRVSLAMLQLEFTVYVNDIRLNDQGEINRYFKAVPVI